MTLRKQVYNLLEPSVSGWRAARFIEVSLIALIFLNIVAIILESVQEINNVYGKFFVDFENLSVIIFSVEYAMRIWTAPENPKYQKRFGRVRYGMTSMSVIDLLSIVPFYLSLLSNFFAVDLRFIRMVRMFRLIRVLKIARYLKALNLMQAVFRERKEQIFLSVVFIIFLLLIVSTLMYHIEHDAQPEAFSSIPASMWWGIETLTTVGYGDLVPQTKLGKVLGGMIAILGIGLFALPAGILSSGLTDQLHKSGNKRHSKGKAHGKTCPHCGGDLED